MSDFSQACFNLGFQGGNALGRDVPEANHAMAISGHKGLVVARMKGVNGCFMRSQVARRALTNPHQFTC